MANSAYQSSHTGAQIDAAVDAVANKADAATTLAGYGITDAYTKTESSQNFYAIYGGTNLSPSSSNPIDLNSKTDPDSYYCSNGTNAQYVSHRPVDRNAGFRLWVTATIGTSASYKRQRFQYYDQVNAYERYTTNGGTSWSDWEKVQGAMVTVYSGSTAPSSSTGVDGDIYIQTS